METDNTFFPRSARFEFKLHCSKEVEQREGYTALHKEMEKSTKDMKILFKSYVIRATRMENEATKDAILTNFATNIRHVVQAFCVGHNNLPSADVLTAMLME